MPRLIQSRSLLLKRDCPLKVTLTPGRRPIASRQQPTMLLYCQKKK